MDYDFKTTRTLRLCVFQEWVIRPILVDLVVP